MLNIIISPYSRPMRNGNKNPKNYPWWSEVVKKLRERGHHVTQVGVRGEESLDADEIVFNAPLKKLTVMLKECDTWASVDNFFQHLAHLQRKPGVVLFGQSDPNIFGHGENRNLLKDKKYLREKQFDIWEVITATDAAFVTPDEVVEALTGAKG